MYDQNFKRTVVLLVEHGEQGSLGFVLNRQLQMSIEQIVEGFPLCNSAVFMGGPVEQSTLHYVHRLGDQIPDSREVMKGVYWGGSFEALRSLFVKGQVTDSDVLFFVGYSGWAPGQLDEELKRKSWIVAPEDPMFIFQDDYKDMWRNVLKSMGTKYQVISNYPIDPSLN